MAEIDDHGYTVLEGVIEPDLVDALAADLGRLEEELGIVPADNLFEGLRTTRIYNLLAHGQLYEQIPVYPEVLEVVERVLDPGLLVSSLSSIAIGPGERRPAAARRRPDDPASHGPTPRSSATPCGRSPTSPRRTGRPGWSPASHLLSTARPGSGLSR